VRKPLLATLVRVFDHISRARYRHEKQGCHERVNGTSIAMERTRSMILTWEEADGYGDWYTAIPWHDLLRCEKNGDQVLSSYLRMDVDGNENKK